MTPPRADPDDSPRAAAGRGPLREPLLHFVLLGAAIFVAYDWIATPPPNPRRIVVSEPTRAALRAEHRELTGREPTREEEETLVERYIDNEVLTREAIARGLDRDDLIVRRRLIQKMEFVAQDNEPVPEPSEAELHKFLADNAARYAAAERVSFVHVYRSGAADAPALAGWREQLAAGADPRRLGEPFARGHEFRLRTRREVEEVFGGAFAEALFVLRPGEWSQPIASPYGLHLVRVDEHRPAQPPDFEAVRDRLRADWREERRAAANRAALRKLRAGYEVIHEGR